MEHFDITKITVEDEITTESGTDDAKPEPKPVADADKTLTIEKTVSQIEIESKAMTVTDQASAEKAAAWLRTLKATQKDVKAHFDPIREALYRPYKKVQGQIKKLDDVLSAADGKVKKMVSDWQKADEKKRQAAENKRLEAERKAEAERQRKIKEREDKAKEAEAAGMPIPEPEPEPVPEPVAPVAPIETPKKLEGFSMRDNWTFEVEDFAAVPDMFKVIDEKALNALAKSTKGKKKVAGVKFVNNKTAAVRA